MTLCTQSIVAVWENDRFGRVWILTIPSVLSDGLRTVAGQVRQVVPAIGIAYSCLLAREEEVR